VSCNPGYAAVLKSWKSCCPAVLAFRIPMSCHPGYSAVLKSWMSCHPGSPAVLATLSILAILSSLPACHTGTCHRPGCPVTLALLLQSWLSCHPGHSAVLKSCLSCHSASSAVLLFCHAAWLSCNFWLSCPNILAFAILAFQTILISFYPAVLPFILGVLPF
jgi:hypothetical protein